MSKKHISLLLLAVAVCLSTASDLFAQSLRNAVRRAVQPRTAVDSPVDNNSAENQTVNNAGQQNTKEKEKEAKTVYAYAVLIGVNNYPQPKEGELKFEALNCCVKDMTALRDAFVTVKFAKPEDIVLLTDDSSGDYKPTAENIRRELKKANEKAAADEVVLVAFSGHGIALPVQEKGVTIFQSFLCPSDAKIIYDSEKREYHTGNSLIPLSELFGDAKSKKEAVMKVAIIDACRNLAPVQDGAVVTSADHSAGIELARKGAVLRGGKQQSVDLPPFAEQDLMVFENIVRLSSCRKGQESLEEPEIGHGVFTKYVVEGLLGEADKEEKTDKNGKSVISNGDGETSFFELTSYVIDKTEAFVREKYKGKMNNGKPIEQKPSMSANETTTAYVMGYTGKARESMDLDQRKTLVAQNQGTGRFGGMSPQQRAAIRIGWAIGSQFIPGNVRRWIPF